jgi:hypothetical protein
LLALSACIPASCATYDDATIDLCYADAAP